MTKDEIVEYFGKVPWHFPLPLDHEFRSWVTFNNTSKAFFIEGETAHFRVTTGQNCYATLHKKSYISQNEKFQPYIFEKYYSKEAGIFYYTKRLMVYKYFLQILDRSVMVAADDDGIHCIAFLLNDGTTTENHYSWFKENGIDITNLTQEDVTLLKMKITGIS